MTQVILTHTGSPVPEYTEICIKQLRYTNPDINISLISDTEHGGEAFCIKNGILFIPSSEFSNDPLLKKFREVSWFKAWGKPETTYPSPENFVQGTSERLFLLAACLKKYELEDILHIENDNLIYGNIDSIIPHLSINTLTCCFMSKKYTVWNLVYIPYASLLYEAMEWYVDKLSKGNDWIVQNYGLDMVHEMTVMSRYEKLTFLPSLLIEGSIENYYFDPASYGQYIAGTNNGHPPGFLDKINHDIAKEHGKSWNTIIFDRKSNPRITIPIDSPVQLLPGITAKLFNLHMHNKTKMSEYATYE